MRLSLAARCDVALLDSRLQSMASLASVLKRDKGRLSILGARANTLLGESTGM